MELFTQRHAAQIDGELSCFDRIVITGTIPAICYADGMTSYLRFKGIRIFDYTKWAEPLREQVRTNAQRLAQEAGLEIEFLKHCGERKEALVRERLEKRGAHEGLVRIFSAREACSSYQPWHDKQTAVCASCWTRAATRSRVCSRSCASRGRSRRLAIATSIT